MAYIVYQRRKGIYCVSGNGEKYWGESHPDMPHLFQSFEGARKEFARYSEKEKLLIYDMDDANSSPFILDDVDHSLFPKK